MLCGFNMADVWLVLVHYTAHSKQCCEIHRSEKNIISHRCIYNVHMHTLQFTLNIIDYNINQQSLAQHTQIRFSFNNRTTTLSHHINVVYHKMQCIE